MSKKSEKKNDVVEEADIGDENTMDFDEFLDQHDEELEEMLKEAESDENSKTKSIANKNNTSIHDSKTRTNESPSSSTLSVDIAKLTSKTTKEENNDHKKRREEKNQQKVNEKESIKNRKEEKKAEKQRQIELLMKNDSYEDDVDHKISEAEVKEIIDADEEKVVVIDLWSKEEEDNDDDDDQNADGEKTSNEKGVTPDSDESQNDALISSIDEEEKLIDEKLMSLIISSKNITGEQKKKKGYSDLVNYSAEEIVESRISGIVSTVLNKFGRVIDPLNPDILIKKQKEAVDMANKQKQEGGQVAADMIGLSELKPSLQRKLILIECTMESLSKLVELMIRKNIKGQKRVKKLQNICLRKDSEVAKLEQELQLAKEKIDKITKLKNNYKKRLAQYEPSVAEETDDFPEQSLFSTWWNAVSQSTTSALDSTTTATNTSTTTTTGTTTTTTTGTTTTTTTGSNKNTNTNNNNITNNNNNNNINKKGNINNNKSNANNNNNNTSTSNTAAAAAAASSSSGVLTANKSPKSKQKKQHSTSKKIQTSSTAPINSDGRNKGKSTSNAHPNVRNVTAGSSSSTTEQKSLVDSFSKLSGWLGIGQDSEANSKPS